MEESSMFDYEDRGIIKWQGMYLSDHTEKIASKTKETAQVNVAKTQMTTEAISEVLNKALIKRESVAIQIKERDSEGYYPNDIVGVVLGHDELGIYVGSSKVNYDEIRHVEFYHPVKWSLI
uniref:Hypothetic protein n=1 Tax=Enterococcus durans TaxID=53345 RepID=F8WK36_9ENTE|nr:hypothetic protein [Enterococcus durans]